MLKTLRLIRGLPGSGKSTYANSKYFGGMLVIEADQYYVTSSGKYDYIHGSNTVGIDYMRTMAATAMSQEVNLIVCDVFPRVSDVEVFRNLAETYGYGFSVACMHGKFKNIHDVDSKRMLELELMFEKYPGETNILASDNFNYSVLKEESSNESEN